MNQAKATFGKRVGRPGFPRTRRVMFDARRSALLSDMLAALARYARKWWSNDSGVAAVEFGLITAALAPVFIAGGAHLGPPLLAWATPLHQDVIAAQALADQLAGGAGSAQAAKGTQARMIF